MTTTTLNGPADPAPTLTYNGSWIGGDSAIAPITATVPANAAVKPFTGALAPMPQVTEYTIPTNGSQPEDLVKGPDGNVWFTENGGKIGRVTTSGAFTEFAVPPRAEHLRGESVGHHLGTRRKPVVHRSRILERVD